MFFGRNQELDRLASLWRKKVASLVTCRGRRRIGKSTLIEEFAKRTGARFIKIEGKRPERKWTNAIELQTFAEQLAAQTGAERTPPSNWLNAFIRLSDKVPDDEKTVVLLDEISWLGHFDETFASTLKIAWDNYFKKHDRLILVVCGSVSGWIRENIIDNGAFLGRRSLDLFLRELPLAECAKFWGKPAGRIDSRERRFRLRDNYSRYYLKFVEPVGRMIDDESYRFTSLAMLDGWDAVMSLAFENLIVNNYAELLPHLHLGNTLITSAAPYRKSPVRGRGGCQIDLLLQSQDMICVVEVKRRNIDKSIIAEVDRKASCIARRKGVSIRTALVFDGAIEPTVEANGYFDAIVDAASLLTAGNCVGRQW